MDEFDPRRKYDQGWKGIFVAGYGNFCKREGAGS